MRIGLLVIGVAAVADGLARSSVGRMIGSRRDSPLEVLIDSRNAKDIRRAETAWRRGWEKGFVAPAEDITVAFRALASIRDGGKAEVLLRTIERTEVANDRSEAGRTVFSAAMTALALGSRAETAQTLYKRRPTDADAIAVALVANSETRKNILQLEEMPSWPVIRALLNMQRSVDFTLDLHGLGVDEVDIVLRLLFADTSLSLLPPEARENGLCLVTGRGLHSSGVSATSEASSPVRSRVLDFFQGDDLTSFCSYANEIRFSPLSTTSSSSSSFDGDDHDDKHENMMKKKNTNFSKKKKNNNNTGAFLLQHLR